MATTNQSNLLAIVEFVSKSGKVIKDSCARVSDITATSVIVHSKYYIKDIEQINSINIFLIDGEKTKVVISGNPKDVKRSNNYAEYHCNFKKSVGAAKYINIHKAKRKKERIV